MDSVRYVAIGDSFTGGFGDVIRALNWPDRDLAAPAFWSPDRLHLNSRGHHRVAARVLTALLAWARRVPAGTLRGLGAATARRHVIGRRS